jgi:REP element-mobilizing transposase RayT
MTRLCRTYGTPTAPGLPSLELAVAGRLRHEPVELDPRRRLAITDAIRQHCAHRGWTLHASYVGTNHVHVVVSTNEAPERVMNQLKAWATRRMVEAGAIPVGMRPWSRHGSTRYLWSQVDLERACLYVEEGQSQPAVDVV